MLALGFPHSQGSPCSWYLKVCKVNCVVSWSFSSTKNIGTTMNDTITTVSSSSNSLSFLILNVFCLLLVIATKALIFKWFSKQQPLKPMDYLILFDELEKFCGFLFLCIGYLVVYKGQYDWEWKLWIHVFSVKQNSMTENFQTENCKKENSGTRKFQESQFFMEFENSFLEKIPGFYFKQGRKFQDFWLIIITGVKILWQNFPRHSIF